MVATSVNADLGPSFFGKCIAGLHRLQDLPLRAGEAYGEYGQDENGYAGRNRGRTIEAGFLQ